MRSQRLLHTRSTIRRTQFNRAHAMDGRRTLLAVLAHPDDESLGFGGTLAKYAAEGAHVHLVTATRGESGRYGDGTEHPGPAALGRIRESELRAAARELGVRDVSLLDYVDGQLDRADPVEAISRIVAHIRRIRPHVVITFGPEGVYGHPDHIAISQLATAATLAAADPSFGSDGAKTTADVPHHVAKFYYMGVSPAKWQVYEAAFKRLVSRVDGIEREPTPWPEWALTTVLDADAHWRTVWRAVRCHTSQLAIYRDLEELSEQQHRMMWGRQEFYRVFSLVNGGRHRETDLFEGVAPNPAHNGAPT